MAQLGEHRAIQLLTRVFDKNPAGLPLGFEDDVGAIPISPRFWIVLKCDMLVARTDVPPGMTHFEMGRKAVVSVISDFAAKGVKPRGVTVAIGLSREMSGRELSMIGRGLVSASKQYACPIVGGDTNESRELVIDIAGFGLARPGEIVQRDGAGIGDIVAVTGPFGDASAGLRAILSREKMADVNRKLVRAVTRPKARLREGLRLAHSGLLTSSIDSSDGLAWSLHEIARMSNVGIRVAEIPVSKTAREYAEDRNISPYELALYGGEEYELVVTMKGGSFAKAKRIVPSLIRIGTVVNGDSVMARLDGSMCMVETRGWEHFRTKMKC